MRKHVIAMLVLVAASTVSVFIVLAVVDNVPGISDSALYLLVFGLLLLAVVPPTSGYLVSTWTVDPERAPVSVHIRRIRIISGAVEAAATIALTTFAVQVGLPPWIPIIVVGGSLLALVISLYIGERSRLRGIVESTTLQPWSPMSKTDLARRYRRAAMVFTATFVLSVVVLVVLDFTEGALIEVLHLAVTLGAFAASFTFLPTIVSVQPYLAKLRPDLLEDNKAVAKRVMKGQPIELTPKQRVSAVRYATLMEAYWSLFGLQQVLFDIGWAFLQLGNFAQDQDIFAAVLGTVFVVLAIAVTIVSVRQLRKVRAYLASHPDDVAAAVAEDDLIRAARADSAS